MANTLHGDGYLVLAAAHSYEALQLSRTYEGVIDLLIADADIPRMGSQELCEQIKRDRPRIECLLISSAPVVVAAQRKQPLVCQPFDELKLRQAVKELLWERS